MPLSSLRGTLYTRSSEFAGESSATLDIDGLSDLGEAIVDADLLIIDNGGDGGDNVKFAASRIPTYVYSSVSGDITIDSSGVASLATNIIIDGNLTVNGTTVTVNSTTVTVDDPMFALADNNSADTVDIGWYGKYVDSGTKYSGLVRDASDTDMWKLFATTGNSHEAPSTTVNTTSGFTLANLSVNELTGTLATAAQANITGLGTIATGTWEATDVGVAHGGTGVSTLLTNAILTGNGASAIQAESTLSFTGDILSASSTSADLPMVELTNTHAGATAGKIRFNKDSASGDDNDVMGTIEFYGTDAAENTHERFAYIDSYIIDSAHGSEAAGLRFYVAENDATNTLGLQILGQPDADGEVDITLGAGVASTTTIAGTLTMGSTLAMSNAGLVSVANQSGITGLGTITSGTWQGTTVAVNQGGTGATSLTNLITLASHTTGDYVQNITGGTGLTSTGATSGENIAHTLSVDASQAITALTGGDLTIYEDANNADVSLKLGTSATESLSIEVLNGGSNKTAEEVHFSTATASGTADHGKMVFDIDGTDILTIDDGGLVVKTASTIGPVGDEDLLTLTASGSIVTVAGEISATTLDIGGTDIAATAAELNLLDGSAKSTASITIADSDAFIVIDGTTTKQIPASDIVSYASGSSATKGFAIAMAVAL